MPKSDSTKFRTANKYGKKRQKKFYGQTKKKPEEAAVVSCSSKISYSSFGLI